MYRDEQCAVRYLAVDCAAHSCIHNDEGQREFWLVILCGPLTLILYGPLLLAVAIDQAIERNVLSDMALVTTGNKSWLVISAPG
jgi:hypothetical protein